LICAGRLAAGTAYELEQALTRIDLHLNAVLDALESGEARDVAPAVRHALAETDHAGAVMHGLEAFLEPYEERVRPLDVHEAIEIALKLTKVITDRRATLVRRYGVVPLGMASLRRLTHVLVALLRNAANAIPAASPHANSIVVETSTTLDGRAAIEISDTGVGVMFDEHLARVLYATFDDAVEDLALGGPYDLVVCNGRSADCEEFRMRLHESAPDVLSRTLDVVIPPRGSGLFQRVAVLEHEVDVAAVAE
jgi:C4-dicarboxylate-specific signal transduction histidine kinase